MCDRVDRTRRGVDGLESDAVRGEGRGAGGRKVRRSERRVASEISCVREGASSCSRSFARRATIYPEPAYAPNLRAASPFHSVRCLPHLQIASLPP